MDQDRGAGAHALDLHIAYYLGWKLTERPQAQCAVLSKDKGFDPLIRHLHGLRRTCRRVAALVQRLFSENNVTEVGKGLAFNL